MKSSKKTRRSYAKGNNKPPQSRFDILSLLPLEIAVSFFSFLRNEDMMNCRLVCKNWKALVESNENFRRFLVTEFGLATANDYIAKDNHMHALKLALFEDSFFKPNKTDNISTRVSTSRYAENWSSNPTDFLSQLKNDVPEVFNVPASKLCLIGSRQKHCLLRIDESLYNIIDSLRPPLYIKVDGRAQLLDETGSVISSKESDYEDISCRVGCFTVTNYPPGVRFILLTASFTYCQLKVDVRLTFPSFEKRRLLKNRLFAEVAPFFSSVPPKMKEINSILAEDPTFLNTKQFSGDSSSDIFSYAITTNAKPVISLLFNRGCAYDIETLFYACTRVSAYTVKLLIERGINVNVKNEDGQTPIEFCMMTAREDPLPVVRALVEKGADVNQILEDGSNLIMLACKHLSANMITFLTSRGADVNHVNRKGESVLQLAFQRRNLMPVAATLLNAGADPNTRFNKEKGSFSTPLIEAVYRGSAEAVKVISLLLDKGADVNAQDSNGLSALQVAMAQKCKNNNIVDILRNAPVAELPKNGFNTKKLRKRKLGEIQQ